VGAGVLLGRGKRRNYKYRRRKRRRYKESIGPRVFSLKGQVVTCELGLSLGNAACKARDGTWLLTYFSLCSHGHQIRPIRYDMTQFSLPVTHKNTQTTSSNIDIYQDGFPYTFDLGYHAFQVKCLCKDNLEDLLYVY